MLQIDELQREVDKTLAVLEKEREVSKALLNSLLYTDNRFLRVMLKCNVRLHFSDKSYDGGCHCDS